MNTAFGNASPGSSCGRSNREKGHKSENRYRKSDGEKLASKSVNADREGHFVEGDKIIKKSEYITRKGKTWKNYERDFASIAGIPARCLWRNRLRRQRSMKR